MKTEVRDINCFKDSPKTMGYIIRITFNQRSLDVFYFINHKIRKLYATITPISFRLFYIPFMVSAFNHAPADINGIPMNIIIGQCAYFTAPERAKRRQKDRNL
ncbi:hypothetical protein ADH76_29710 [Enterocloster clostridioformis]|nr:hypothetical protein A4V08_04530 [Lachnoclostridium sp. YL32]OXE63516.1 hypothetical protein ADH76_29710 [Enterocloster clostridioformis]